MNVVMLATIFYPTGVCVLSCPCSKRFKGYRCGWGQRCGSAAMWRAFAASRMTWVQFLQLAWWRVRSDSYKMSSDLRVCMCPAWVQVHHPCAGTHKVKRGPWNWSYIQAAILYGFGEPKPGPLLERKCSECWGISQPQIKLFSFVLFFPNFWHLALIIRSAAHCIWFRARSIYVVFFARENFGDLF